jgi:hypothetical protein
MHLQYIGLGGAEFKHSCPGECDLDSGHDDDLDGEAKDTNTGAGARRKGASLRRVAIGRSTVQAAHV